MTARGSAVLYTPDILALAVELARFPLEDGLPLRGDGHSRLCGSRVTIGIETGEDGKIGTIGAKVSACAIGQAAASIFLQAACGRGAADVAEALNTLEAWLAAEGPEPHWPKIAVLASARTFPARHAAILLPWRAALAALSNPARAV